MTTYHTGPSLVAEPGAEFLKNYVGITGPRHRVTEIWEICVPVSEHHIVK
jgi:hypothetical protein